MKYRFEPFTLDLGQEQLNGPEGDIALRPQAFALLKLLVERAPELLTRDQILDEVWGRHALSVNSLPQVIAEIRSALGDTAANSRFVATKHRRGYHFVADVTIDHDDTTDSVESPPDGPSGLQPPPEAPAAKKQAGGAKWFWWAALAGAVALAAVLFWLRDPGANNLNQLERPSVAVLGFRNLSDQSELSWLNAALADLIGLHLAVGDVIRVVPGEAVARAQLSLELSRWDGLDRETLAFLTDLTKADYVVLGSYLPARSAGSDGVSITARIQNTASGVIEATLTQVTTLDEVTEAAQVMGNQMRDELGIGSLQSDEQSLVARSLPASPDARVAYFRGLERHRALDLSAAIDHLQQATSLDPDAAAVRYALANALVDAGYLVRALQQARLAAVNADALSTREQLEIEALAARLGQDWPGARRDYQALFSFFPDEPSYGYRLLETEIEMGDLSAAEQTLAELGERIQNADNDPLFLLASGDVAAALGDAPDQLAYADSALAAAQRLQSVFLQAAARQSKAKALISQGQGPEAVGELDTAGTLFQSLGADKSFADVLMDLGEVQRGLAEYDAAESSLSRALEIYSRLDYITGRAQANLALGNVAFNRGDDPHALIEAASDLFQESGDYRGVADAQRNLAIASDRAGDPEAAIGHYQAALTAYRRVGDNRGLGATLVSYGGTLGRQARWSEAESILQDGLAQFELIGDKRGQAFALSNLAGVASNLGRNEQVAELNNRALVLYREMGAGDQAARILYNQALAARRRGELPISMAKLQEAESLSRDKGAKRIRLAALTTLADVSLKMGDKKQAQGWLETSEALEVSDQLRRALMLTTRGKLAQMEGDWAAARSAYSQAKDLRESSSSRAWTLSSDLDLAALDLAEGRPVRAEESARRLASEFQRLEESQDHALALMTEAQSLIHQGRSEPARNRLESARSILDGRPDFELNLRLSLLDGMATEGHEPAIERLAWVSEQAQQHGYRLVSLLSNLELVRRYESTGRVVEATRLRNATSQDIAERGLAGISALAVPGNRSSAGQ